MVDSRWQVFSFVHFLVHILPDPVNCFTLHFVIFIFIFISLCRLCLGILDSPAPQLVQSSRCECSLSLGDDGRPNSILAHLDILCFVSCFQPRFQICGIRDTVSSFLIYTFSSYMIFPLLQRANHQRVNLQRADNTPTDIFLLILPCLRSRVIRYYRAPLRNQMFGPDGPSTCVN